MVHIKKSFKKFEEPMKVDLEIVLFLSFCLNVVDKRKKITFWQPLCIEGQRTGKELNTYKHKIKISYGKRTCKTCSRFFEGKHLPVDSGIKDKLITYA